MVPIQASLFLSIEFLVRIPKHRKMVSVKYKIKWGLYVSHRNEAIET